MAKKSFYVNVPTWVRWQVKAENADEAIEILRKHNQKKPTSQNLNCMINDIGEPNYDLARIEGI